MGEATRRGSRVSADCRRDAAKNGLVGSMGAGRGRDFCVARWERLFWTLDPYWRTKKQKAAGLTTASSRQVAGVVTAGC